VVRLPGGLGFPAIARPVIQVPTDPPTSKPAIKAITESARAGTPTITSGRDATGFGSETSSERTELYFEGWPGTSVREIRPSRSSSPMLEVTDRGVTPAARAMSTTGMDTPRAGCAEDDSTFSATPLNFGNACRMAAGGGRKWSSGVNCSFWKPRRELEISFGLSR
jgi:hypothetical protein